MIQIKTTVNDVFYGKARNISCHGKVEGSDL